MKIVVFAVGLISALLIVGCTSATDKNLDYISTVKQFNMPITSSGADQLKTLPEKPQLNDYVLLGLSNNAKLKAIYYQYVSTTYRAEQFSTLPDPTLAFNYYIQEVETKTGPQTFKLSVAQKFPFPGKLKLKGEIQDKNAQIAQINLEKLYLKLKNNIINTYYNLYFINRSIVILNEQMKILEALEKIANVRLKNGLESNQAVLKLHVELGIIENEIKTKKEQLDATISEFNSLLNLPSQTNVYIPDTIEFKSVQSLNREKLFQVMINNNTELKQIRIELEKLQKQLELADKNYYPDFTLGVTYINTSNPSKPITDAGKDPIIALLGINLPIWQGKLDSAKLEAELQFRADNLKLNDVQYTLSSKLDKILFNLDDAKRQYLLYENSLIPKAKESYESSQTAYSTGKVGVINILDTYRILLNFLLMKDKELADYYKNLADLEELVNKVF